MNRASDVTRLQIGVSSLQQCDEPETVYNTPANKFVAGFIGAPPMNFLNGVVTGDRFDLGVMQIEIPKGHPCGGMAGKKVAVGIRPEDIYDASDSPPVAATEGNTFTATVDVLETLGAEDTAYLDVNGSTLTASLDPDSRVKVGASSRFVVNLSKLHVFDHETEQAIR